ncbi:SPOR domain-containing protein [Neokomagataea tanensis]|uniref:SPOR domain-containing protein n=1 Tax=Neokomagataea tanensis TaxID=661191 RepID=A0A4Y6V606_9PROT|nr:MULTISPECIES: SPOR domain-containing protein [Neokomagataea]QDH25373.1 SPOR domain-containing protein [Neokomagataea tanensis]
MSDGGDGYRSDEPPRRDDLPRRPLGGGDDRATARPPEARSPGRERLSQDYDDVPSRRKGAARPATTGTGRGGSTAAGGVTSFLGSDPATRKLVGGAVAIGTVLLVAVGGWSLVGKHHSGVPIIGPPPGPVREVPADPGGMQIMAGDDGADMTGNGEAHLAPAPEQPDTKAFARQYGAPPEAKPAAGPVGGTAPANPPVDVAANNQNNAATASAPTGSTPTQGTEATATGQQAPKAPPAALPPLGVAQNVPPKQSAPLQKNDDGDDEDTGAGTAAAPPVRSAITSRHVSPERERIIRQEVGPAPALQPAPKPAVAAPLPPPSPTPEEAPHSVGTGHHEVQLAALNTDAAAHQEWETLKGKAGGLLAGHSPLFEHTTQGERSFVRLRIGGFTDGKAARAFCVKLHAQSIACTPAQF